MAFTIGSASPGVFMLVWFVYSAFQIGAVFFIARFATKRLPKVVPAEKAAEQDQFFDLLDKSENKRAVLAAYLKNKNSSVPIRVAGHRR